MDRCKNPNCKTCKYRAVKTDVNNCDYILITGKPRNCTVKDCNKYEPGIRDTTPKPIYYGKAVEE